MERIPTSLSGYKVKMRRMGEYDYRCLAYLNPPHVWCFGEGRSPANAARAAELEVVRIAEVLEMARR